MDYAYWVWVIVLLLAVIAFMFITDNSVQAYLGTSTQIVHQYQLSFVLPLIAMILTFMADRGIQADEKLVRSMDRLR